MKVFVGINDCTGEKYTFKLSAIQLDEIDGNECIKAVLTTDAGQCTIL